MFFMWLANALPLRGHQRWKLVKKGGVNVTGPCWIYRNVYFDFYKVSDDILQTAIVISIDEKNKIWLLSSHRAMVDCKLLGKKLFFIGGDNTKAFDEVNCLLQSKSYEIL